MLHEIQKDLTACKKLQASGHKADIAQELKFLNDIVKKSNKRIGQLRAYAIEMDYAYYDPQYVEVAAKEAYTQKRNIFKMK